MKPMQIHRPVLGRQTLKIVFNDASIKGRCHFCEICSPAFCAENDYVRAAPDRAQARQEHTHFVRQEALLRAKN